MIRFYIPRMSEIDINQKIAKMADNGEKLAIITENNRILARRPKTDT